LAQGNDGNFYGTFIHASLGHGTVFKMTPAASVTTLAMVAGLNSGLALADDGNFYGTTTNGGLGYGTIFEVTPAGQVVSVYSLASGNNAPIGLKAGVDGCLYGASKGSNSFFGAPQILSIFQYNTNGSVTTLHSMTNAPFRNPDGITLPIQGTDGFLYGTTSSPLMAPTGGSRISFYRLSTNGSYQTLLNLTNSAGSAGGPASDLIFGPDGWLYGVLTAESFPPTHGSIFKLSTTGLFTNLFQFRSTNGADPEAALLSASDGYLYGTTYHGGSNNEGTIFRISTNGDFTSLLNFNGANGSNPGAPLIQANDGNIYGTTESSAAFSYGTIFRLLQAPMVTNLSFSNATVSLTWTSFTNGIYRVEYESDLAGANWSTLIPSVMATDVTTSVSDNAPAADQRLYRVVLLP